MDMASPSDSGSAIATARKTAETSRPVPWETALNAVRPWLRGRRLYWVVAAVLAAAGLALGWNWLAAVGLLPILLSVLPCVAMCAIGVCAMNQGSKSCGEQKPGDGAPDLAPNRPAVQVQKGDL